MKSIYEASVAYRREHQGTVNIMDFEAGANYVLEQIDKQLVEFSNFEDTLMISRIIKQLKSNQ